MCKPPLREALEKRETSPSRSEKPPLREAQAPKGRTREAKRPAGGDRAPLRSAAMRKKHRRGSRVAPARGGNVRRTKGAQGDLNGCANVTFAKPKHPKAGRGKRPAGGARAPLRSAAMRKKTPSGQQGFPRSRGKCPKDKGGTRRSHQRTTPLPRWERVRVRVIPQRSPTSADQLPVKPYTVRKRRS